MPQSYISEQPRRHSSPTAMPESTHMPSLIRDSGPGDVDDSIVLSDLVRTGEVSRLRRRGAMRIDHNHTHHATAGGHIVPGAPRLSTPNIVLVERSNWDSDSDLDSPVFTSHWNSDPATIRTGRRHPRSSRRYGPYAGTSLPSGSSSGVKDEYLYTLVCGVEVPGSEPVETEPFRPSILPLYPLSSSSSASAMKSPTKSTGCGSVIHVHAAPRSRFRTWLARSAASETVVPMEACYFDTKEAARFSKSACGCVNEGVGCATCGNPLGMRYTPCKSASDGLFCPRLSDKMPSQPGSYPSYGEASASGSKSPSSKHQYVYTFFADAVTSTPSYSFPTPPVRPSRTRSLDNSPLSPVASGPFVPPVRYIYNQDDEPESDAENHPPFGSGWLGSSTVPILDAPTSPHLTTMSTSPADGRSFDQFAGSSPIYEDQLDMFDLWAQSHPLHLRTRTGRTARHSSIGRIYSSLSSGLGGGGIHDEHPSASFYERQLMAASERESRDFPVVDGFVDLWSTHQPASGIRSTLDGSLDEDGETMAWGTVIPDGTGPSRDYKPADDFIDFIER